MNKFGKKLNLIVLALGLFLGSCATERPQGQTEAEVLYQEAQELYDAGRYLLATEKLNTIRSKYSYSVYTAKAELMQADILFKQENYVEAAASYIIFRDFHPKFENLDYVIYKIAESYYQQIPSTFDRDLTAAHEAIKYFEEMLRLFRNSEYAKGAVEKIQTSKQMIKDKEKYIADFYYKTEKFNPARIRYKKIAEQFADDVELRSYAVFKYMQASYHLKEMNDCKSVYRMYSTLISKKYSTLAKDVNDKCTIKE
ncbi:outer membrane assembly lipoprotein YfiO [Bacteriovorax sp. BSW11_IV]|uniref:outer membrane protein assembly factor BamD n=1 Tax=Bacteriovorax sp. BSW11_IV TaxID=1353529 RepID=UPI00038A2C0C|nr:outer membrane protein assembly factor BamD [Bacteriovorax sp. BSW11_IV]EQC45144.1 outer membrane assembly lipoprotein YfiO [Bacteriovorax sp. BSW11_IV]